MQKKKSGFSWAMDGNKSLSASYDDPSVVAFTPQRYLDDPKNPLNIKILPTQRQADDAARLVTEMLSAMVESEAEWFKCPVKDKEQRAAVIRGAAKVPTDEYQGQPQLKFKADACTFWDWLDEKESPVKLTDASSFQRGDQVLVVFQVQAFAGANGHSISFVAGHVYRVGHQDVPVGGQQMECDPVALFCGKATIQPVS